MHSRPEIHRTPTKFSELRYQPWSIDDYICSLNQLLERFRQADGDEAIEIVKDWIRLMNDFISNRTVNKIQYTRDIHDATVKKHRDVLARNLPRYHTANSKFEGEILIHPHRKQLEDVFGEQLFRTIASRQLSRGEEILEYRIREEEILLETDQLLGSSEIEEEERRARYGELFQETVELRTRMAQKMGSSDYSVFANELMGRSMTVSDKMDRFCEECADELIEVALEFRRRYRATFPNHKEGPGIPLDSDTMLENLGKVVCELFPEAEECYSFMQKYELMDIDYTSGKKPNTIECTYIANGNMPYLFVLMNPHSSKYLLLFHEFGHAIAHFCSGADELLPGCRFQPSDDLGELPSIALQILAIEPIVGIYPDKRVELEGRELLDQIRDLADNCLSREFCNFAYRNPDLTQSERDQEHLRLLRKFSPDRKFEPDQRESFEWQDIWMMGRTYCSMNYGMGQLYALQLWARSKYDRAGALDSYASLCRNLCKLDMDQLIDQNIIIDPFDRAKAEHWLGDLRDWMDANLRNR